MPTLKYTFIRIEPLFLEKRSRGCSCSFCFKHLTSPFHKVTLEAEAQGHMAATSGANQCPAGLRTKAGQCFRLVAKTGTNRFLNGANLFFPVIGKLLLLFLTQTQHQQGMLQRKKLPLCNNLFQQLSSELFGVNDVYMKYKASRYSNA